jgi:hypothetical protein
MNYYVAILIAFALGALAMFSVLIWTGDERKRKERK